MSTQKAIMTCPQCGSNKVELDSSAVVECFGHAWQTLSIRCLNEADRCDAGIDFTFDFHSSNNAQDVIIDAWNKLNLGKPRKLV